MRNIAMIVGYDGTAYHGFQSQPDGNTVQDRLEEAVRSLTGERVKVHGSGRTDAGVHARGQVINIHTASRIPIERWCLAMNSRLPDDIVVSNAREVPEDFHARRSALRKTYRYLIHNSMFPDPLTRRYTLHVYRPLDVERMAEGLSYLIGEHDFTSYCSPRTEVEDRVRTLYAGSVRREDAPGEPDARIVVELTGNGFLYNMVRIIVGTLLLVGTAEMEPIRMRRILEAKDRNAAGPTAPAHGLILWSVEYEQFRS
jgi:tRNA pseudouridine38-40 synthase